MPIEVTMPKLSPTMESGVLAQWLVKVGDQVKEGDILADIETDKATMPMKAFDDGVVAVLDRAVGDEVKLGDRVLVLAKKGEDPEKGRRATWRREGRLRIGPGTGSSPREWDQQQRARGVRPIHRCRRRRGPRLRRWPGEIEPVGPKDRSRLAGRHSRRPGKWPRWSRDSKRCRAIHPDARQGPGGRSGSRGSEPLGSG